MTVPPRVRPDIELIEALPPGEWKMRAARLPGQEPMIILVCPDHPPRFLKAGMMHSEKIKP